MGEQYPKETKHNHWNDVILYHAFSRTTGQQFMVLIALFSYNFPPLILTLCVVPSFLLQ